MSKQYPGGLITKSPVTPSGPYSNSTASGIWTLDQQAYWQKLGQWPNANNPPIDPQFNYVTMLLHGDGTNGAQNNTFLDSSANNYTITRYGNTTQGSFSPYGSNWSNAFDGDASGDNLIAVSANTANAMGTGDWTAEAWIFLNVGGLTPFIMDTLPTTSGSTTGLRMRLNASNQLQLWQYSSAVLTSSTAVSVGAWTHVALVKSSGTTTAYINGTASNTYSDSGNYTCGTNRPMIGSDGYNNGSENTLNGYISNLRLVKGTAVYTGNFTPSTTPLTAITNTSLLACQSNRFKDNSSNNFTLTANGTPTVQRFNPFGTSTAYSTSVIGGSAYYDSSGDSLSTPASSANIPQSGDDYTVEAWIYITVLGNVTTIYSGDASGYFAYRSAGRFEFVSSSLELRLTFPVPLNQWCHAAVTRQSGTVRMFINGALTSPTVASGSATGNTDTLLGSGATLYYFGSYTDSTSGPFGGYISNFRIVKGTAVYTAAFTPPTAPLTAVTNTAILLNNTNGAIFDNAMMNNLETVGNAQISTSVVKYGTGSLAFDGTGDYIVSALAATPNLNLGAGSFTLEFWVNPTALVNEARMVTIEVPSSTTVGVIMGGGGSGGSNNDVQVNQFGAGTLLNASAVLSTGTWVHIAVTYNGTTSTLWVGGISKNTYAGSVFPNSNCYVTMGGSVNYSSSTFNGYLDDIRITKGFCRYTTTFTPPTAAFFNYGPT
jgi:hypothetical protein